MLEDLQLVQMVGTFSLSTLPSLSVLPFSCRRPRTSPLVIGGELEELEDGGVVENARGSAAGR